MSTVTAAVLNMSATLQALETANVTDQKSRDPISHAVLQTFHCTMTTFWMAICVSGICTNVINIRTFLRMGLEDSVTILFFALAVSDFNICSMAVLELLAFICGLFEYELELWFFLPPYIPIVWLMCVRKMFNTSTILITTFLALQRCVCVVFPFHVKGMFIKSRTFIFLSTIFTFSIICYSLLIWRHRTVPVMNEAWNATQLQMYVLPGSEPYLLLMEVVLGIGLNITCQIIVMVCLVVMRFALRKAVQFRQSAMSTSTENTKKTKALEQGAATEKTNSKETQAIVQVALLSVIFIVTNSPFLGFGIANLLIPKFGLNDEFHNLYHLVHNFMFTGELVNSSVNFIVYYKYNSKFKRYCFVSSKKNRKKDKN